MKMEFGDIIILIVAAITIFSSASKYAKKMKRSKTMSNVKKTIYFDANGNPVTKKPQKTSVLKSFMDEIKKNIEQNNSYTRKEPVKRVEPMETVPVQEKVRKEAPKEEHIHDIYRDGKKKKKVNSFINKKSIKNGIIFKEIIDSRKF